MKNLNRKNAGFTLAELLVVVTIIGVLVLVILASLNSIRIKKSDTIIKAGMSNIEAQSEIYYDSPQGANRYAAMATTSCTAPNSMFANPSVTQDINNITAQTSFPPACFVSSNGQKWAVHASLNGGGILCMDNSGWLKEGVAHESGTCDVC